MNLAPAPVGGRPAAGITQPLESNALCWTIICPLQIRHGAHLDAVDQDLNTPLHVAVRSEIECTFCEKYNATVPRD